MLSCILCGGLGNQLFILFATIAVSIEYDIPLILPDDYNKNSPNRIEYVDSLFAPIHHLFGTNSKTVMDPKQFTMLQYKQHHYKKITIDTVTKNYCLYGFFQSPIYFQKYSETIINMLQLPACKERVESRLLAHYPDFKSKQSICMHFRLGDYVRLQSYHNILPDTYYKNALKHLFETNGIRTEDMSNIMIYVFCEAGDWMKVKETMDTIQLTYPEVEYRRVDLFSKDYDELLCMSLCDYNIIANSTFSWWGAYLNKRSYMENTVFYPSQWFGPILARSSNTNDMFLPNWTRIQIQ